MCQYDYYTIASQWKTHRPSSMIAGRLCYYRCTTQSDLPVREVEYGCTEPNYETKTYNLFQSCNQQNVRSDVQYGLSHILFLTRYHGRNESYKNRFLIVGYYEIGYSQRIHGRTAIRAKNLHFVPVEHAYEITDKRWEQIKPPGAKKLTSMRQATQRITDNLIDEILQHLADRQNRVDDYVKEVKRLHGHGSVLVTGKNKCSPVESRGTLNC